MIRVLSGVLAILIAFITIAVVEMNDWTQLGVALLVGIKGTDLIERGLRDIHG